MKPRATVMGLVVAIGCARTKTDATATATATPTATASVGSASATATAAPSPAPEGMILVPAGPFTMGADRGGQEDEHPAHQVTLAAFSLDKTEVTNAAYERCVAAKVCRPHDPKS